MPRSIPSATCRHSATPEAMSCMLMAKSPEMALLKSSVCHETVMALQYQVVYYHRQLDSGKIDIRADHDRRCRGRTARGPQGRAAQGGDGGAGACDRGRDRRPSRHDRPAVPPVAA